MKYVDVHDDGLYDDAIRVSRQDVKKLKKFNNNTLDALERYASNAPAIGSTEKIHRVINGIVKSSLQSQVSISVWSKGYYKDAYHINRAMRHKFRTHATIVHKGLNRESDAQLAIQTPVGGSFSFHEFVSSSYLLAVSRNFASTGVILKIESPIGIPIGTNRDEREFLLPAESIFEVLESSKEMWGNDQEDSEEYTIIRVRQRFS